MFSRLHSAPRPSRRRCARFVTTVAWGVLSSCGPSTRDVESALDEANYCSTVEECVDVGPWCPFGCSLFVNVDEVEAIEALRDEYRERCIYKCFPSAGVACVDGVCEPVYRPYWLPAAPAPGAPLVGGSP